MDAFKELDENAINTQIKDPDQPSRKNSDDSQKQGVEEENKEEEVKIENNIEMGGQFKQYLKVFIFQLKLLIIFTIFIKKFSFIDNKCIIKFKLPLDSKKLLMIK